MEVFCTSPHPFHHQQSAQNNFYYQFREGPQENWWKSYESEEESSSTNEEEDDILGRFSKELDLKGHELINKLVSKLENNLPFEEDFRETCHHLRGRSASHMLEKVARKVGRERKRGFERRERGVDLEGELKNERFKVKSMNVVGSGVVKEEQRHE